MKNRLLIVGDDDDFVRLLYHRCQSIGADVLSPTVFADATRVLNNESVNLICLDTDLATGVGCQLADHLREQTVTNKIPVIVLTECEDLATLRACVRVGGYYVHKSPTLWSRLKPILHEFLELPTYQPTHGESNE